LTLLVVDREVIVTMSHVSIECAAIDAAVAHPETLALVKKYEEQYQGIKVIVGELGMILLIIYHFSYFIRLYISSAYDRFALRNTEFA
jgi:hypothetical protein